MAFKGYKRGGNSTLARLCLGFGNLLAATPGFPAPQAVTVHPSRTRRGRFGRIAGRAALLSLTLTVLSLVHIDPVGATTLERRVVTSNDDAEESATGKVSRTSSDLELVNDGTDQTVGMRWAALTIPAGVTITAAYIQFSAKESQSVATSLVLRGQAADNPLNFGSANGGISTRPRTTAATNWAPVAWTVGQVGANQRTPDLSAVIQEIVSRPGWASGNALVMIVNGTGHRTAWAWDGSVAGAPLLHVEYDPPDFPPVASLTVSQLFTPALTLRADASGSTDTDATPIASYQFDFGDGSPVVTTTAPTATAQHTYAAMGPYTVTLTATDTANKTSTPASTTITVQPDFPPAASVAVTQLATPALTVSANGSGSTDTDLTPIASYQFDFGDGSPVVTTTAPTASAQHTYAAAGPYTVTLTVTDTGSNPSTPASTTTTVQPDFPPAASLAVTQLATPMLTMRADASGSTDADLTPIASYQFDFGDGSPVVTTTAPTATAQHAYAAPGPYTVTLIVTDTGNNASTPASFPIAVDPPPDFPPVASVAVTQVVTPALTVSASGSGSTDTDLTPIASYQFDFGDGSPVVTTTAPTATAQHTYAAPGPYTVTLTVTDTGSNPSTPASATISIQPDFPPAASLAVTQLATPVLTVSASGSASTDTDLTPIASYHFNFGDGTPVVNTTAPTSTAQHTYAAAGPYTVTLTVTDTGNNTSTPASFPVTVNPPPDSPPVASLAVTQLATPALTVSASGSGSTDTDFTPIASYHFNFGDGSPVVNTTAPTATAQHTYAAAGPYTVTLTVTDTGNNTSTPASATITVNPSATPIIVERRVATSADDAEESSGAVMYLTSSDLELVYDGNNQTVGMRWTGLGINPGATITSAYIQFSAKESQSEVTNLVFRAQAADNPATFGTANGDVSTRPRTTAATNWAPVAWTLGEVGANQRTPDLSAAIQEIVNRPGWAYGNALVMIVNGTGHRTAWAYNGSTTAAPLLHVEFVGGTPPDLPPNAALNVTQLTTPPLTVRADASGSTDTDATPIASYQFNFGDGTPVVTTTAPTAIAQHTYAAASFYTVTVTATDTANKTSTPASTTLAVTQDGGPLVAVYVGYMDSHHPVNPQPKPNPWRGSPNVVFVGTPDGLAGDPPTGGWDTSTIRVDNLTSGTLSGVVVTCDIGTHHYALWGTNTIPAGNRLILAQTGFENFDGSDSSPGLPGCYGCDPTTCTTLRSSIVPVVHVSIGGNTLHYYDPAQMLNTQGADAAGCPYVGGPLPQTRYDESEDWTPINTTPPPLAARFGPEGEASPGSDAPRALWLAPPAPNPSRGQFAVRFATPRQGHVRVVLYDLTGRVVHRFVDGELYAGGYNFKVDLHDIASGIYFISLETPEATEHKKLVLMR